MDDDQEICVRNIYFFIFNEQSFRLTGKTNKKYKIKMISLIL